MPIPLKLQVFEGPMDLLMHLIEKNKIDIYDIPIVTITDQYLEYVRQMEHSDMNVTSEFLVMAATLLDIKSRMLLPREENEEGEEEDPRDELVKRLLEYKMYKFMSEELREKSRVRKRRKSRVDPIRSGFGKIHREVISVSDKTLYIRAYLKSHPHADFREMLEREDSKEEIIVTFLVILELMKHQKIRITQEEAFGKILIDLVDPDENNTAKTETEPANEEAEPEPLPPPEEPADLTDEPDPGLIPEVPSEPSASVEKRHLVHRPRLGRYGIGIQAYRFTARRSGRDLYRRARGNRIWKRKRNRGRVLRRIRKDKR